MEFNKDGSDDTVRRLTDEYGRHKLTDVQEENEDEVIAGIFTAAPRNRYSSIGSTASSMDYLWDLHPRRLSEAGLSRHSDNSTVLTEDTDSFIIGQRVWRVWVGGTKPGSIAYIGETQFAPGDWAGIVLDQPIGKNDGSVGGTRYFQCEPKKGVFSRLTRLTRQPLDGDNSVFVDPTSTPMNGTRRSPISPSGSLSPLKSPPSLTTSNTSLASAHIDFKLGDRVIIKSSQGSKIGTLRFMGSTEFAAGEWCGVELDEPRGKNDGSVGGKSYFNCRPNFGLFAPVSKVSRSPSNRKPAGCIVHSGTGLPPSGFRRANSKESLTSNTSITSAASGVRRVRLGVTSLTTPQRTSPKTPATAPLPTRTALQEVLKEKQQHIEQLLKERDLERAEIAKAASQADEAEQKYVTLKQDFDFYRLDAEKKLQDHVSLLTQLKNEMKELLSNLEDEKRKNEDLQFRFEEAAIAKADLEVSNETNLVRITELENQLSSERQRVEVLEGDSNKLFEAEETLVRIKEENEALKYEIEVAAKKIQSLESEGTSNKDLVSTHEKELEHLQQVVKQRDETIEKIKTDIKSVSDQYEQSRINFTKEIEEYKSKVAASSNESAELKGALDLLRIELKQVKDDLDLKSVNLSKTIENSKQLEDNLNKEIEKLKMTISGKNLDLENSTESLKRKDDEIKGLTTQIQSFKANLESQVVDLNKSRDSAKEVEDTLRRELDESRATIKLKISEFEDAKKELILAVNQKDSDLIEANKTIKTNLDEIEKLKATITEIKDSSSKTSEEIQTNFTKKLNELEEKNQNFMKTLNEKDDFLTKSSQEITKLQNDLSIKSEDVKNAQNNLETVRTKLEEESALLSKTNESLNELRLNYNDLERKLKTSEENVAELVQYKSRLEEEVRNLVGSSGDYSNRLDELSKELQEKDKNISSVRNDLTTKLQDMERSKEEIEMRYNTYVQKSEKEHKDLEDMVNNLTTAKNSIKEEFDKTALENKNVIDVLNLKLNEVQKALDHKEVQLKKIEEESKESQEKLRTDSEKVSGEYNTRIEDLLKKLDELSQDNNEIKEALSKKSLQFIEMESKYNQGIELSKQNELEIKSKFEETIKQLEHKMNDLENDKLQLSESGKNHLSEKIKEMDEETSRIRKEFEAKIALLEEERGQANQKLSNLVGENDQIKKDLETTKSEGAKIVEEFRSKLENLQETLKNKEESLVKLQEESASKEAKLKDEISKFSGDLQSNILGYQNQVDSLNKEKDDLQKALSNKEEQIRNNTKNYDEAIAKNKMEFDDAQLSFGEEKKRILEQLNQLSLDLKNKEKELDEVKQLNKTSDLSANEKIKEIGQLKSELQINHSFIERLQAEKKELIQQKENLTNSELEKEKQLSELNQKFREISDELRHTNENSFTLQTVTNIYVTILQLLQLSEQQKINLVDQLDSSVKNNVDEDSYAKLCKIVDGIKVLDLDDSKDVKIKDLEREMETFRHKQFELETKLKKQESHIPRPGAKTIDSSKIVNNGNKIDNSTELTRINNNPPVTNEQLMEEKLLAESQVAFLNSIIVDMQKKNEEQKARIEILESGYSPAAADELGLFKLSGRNLPPRMYCDICEEFDLHETEDCPQQANEDMPAVREKSPKEKPQQRPYCEICEMFGHATEDCQEDQTF
ncbi:CAP-Gly domain [Popillia japonica]|uniref:CAP-Gly domain n=1 Tax=Popillia japonica TaxID=7064 RepID=A0AAW1LW04_POPJA